MFKGNYIHIYLFVKSFKNKSLVFIMVNEKDGILGKMEGKMDLDKIAGIVVPPLIRPPPSVI